MDKDDYQIIGVDRNGDILVGARHGTNGYDWPTFIEHNGKTYKFASNEPITIEMATHFGGHASYSPFASKPVMEMRLCEQQFLTLRPNQLYYFTVDPECKNCFKIAALYENN